MVAVVLRTRGGVVAAPKVASYDVAKLAAFQVRVGASETPVEPGAGLARVGAAGAHAVVVKRPRGCAVSANRGTVVADPVGAKLRLTVAAPPATLVL